MVSLWVRPIAVVGAGYLTDRRGAVSMTMGAFVLLAVGSLTLASGFIGPVMVWIFLLTIVRSTPGDIRAAQSLLRDYNGRQSAIGPPLALSCL